MRALVLALVLLLAPLPVAAQKVMLFGGAGNETYLGCFSCSEVESDSILNQYGQYGSRYSTTSIMNRYGPYGSRYSAYSACNPVASSPPVLVDEHGTFYGRLTLNRFVQGAVTNERILLWLRERCES